MITCLYLDTYTLTVGASEKSSFPSVRRAPVRYAKSECSGCVGVNTFSTAAERSGESN